MSINFIPLPTSHLLPKILRTSFLCHTSKCHIFTQNTSVTFFLSQNKVQTLIWHLCIKRWVTFPHLGQENNNVNFKDVRRRLGECAGLLYFPTSLQCESSALIRSFSSCSPSTSSSFLRLHLYFSWDSSLGNASHLLSSLVLSIRSQPGYKCWSFLLNPKTMSSLLHTEAQSGLCGPIPYPSVGVVHTPPSWWPFCLSVNTSNVEELHLGCSSSFFPTVLIK